MKNELLSWYRRLVPFRLRNLISPRYSRFRSSVSNWLDNTRRDWPVLRGTPHADFDYSPWLFWTAATPAEQRRQQAYQARLKGVKLGRRCFVSSLAGLVADEITLGDDCYIGAYAYITDRLTAGSHCTFNPFVILRGRVALGHGVRIGARASLLGVNHVADDPEVPIYLQGLSKQGITVGDDVWIGSGAIVIDGVTIGSHSIIAAGAVVTGDIPAYSLAAGNPARVIRDRRSGPKVPPTLRQRLSEFGDRVAAEWPDVLRRCLVVDGPDKAYVDRSGAPPTARAWGDAVEIAALFGGTPPGFERDELVERLRGFQDRETGLPLDPRTRPVDKPWQLSAGPAQYNILSVGYALELLGASFRGPIAAAETLTPRQLRSLLDQLPWRVKAWKAGGWVDALATALYFNRRYFGSSKTLQDLHVWLARHQDPDSGLWGRPTSAEKWLQPVNGFYRIARGAYVQFGVPVPAADKILDSVLHHAQHRYSFGEGGGNASNVLDVAYSLWLCGRQSGLSGRVFQVEAWATQQLSLALTRWRPSQGFSYDVHPSAEPSLRGTELWLAALYMLADLHGESAALGYRPAGVHSLEPRLSLG